MARSTDSKTKAGEYAVVVSRFHEPITQRLLDACLAELKRNGIKTADITVVWVPGAFEIPVAALKLAKQKTVRAVICLGAIVKGETLHYELVARESAKGVMDVALRTGKPVIFEILSAETLGLVQARAEKDGTNKGVDAARAAVEMVDLFRRV